MYKRVIHREKTVFFLTLIYENIQKPSPQRKGAGLCRKLVSGMGEQQGSMAPVPLGQDTPGTEQVKSFTLKPDSEHCPCSHPECPHYEVAADSQGSESWELSRERQAESDSCPESLILGKFHLRVADQA